MKCVLAYRNNKTLRLWFYLFCFFGTFAVLILNKVIDLEQLNIQQEIYFPATLGVLALTLVGFFRRIFIPSVRMEYDTEGIYIYTPTKKTKFIPFKNIRTATCGLFPDGQITIITKTNSKTVVTCVGKRKEVLNDLNSALDQYAVAQKKKQQKEAEAREKAAEEARNVTDINQTTSGWNQNSRHGVK